MICDELYPRVCCRWVDCMDNQQLQMIWLTQLKLFLLLGTFFTGTTTLICFRDCDFTHLPYFPLDSCTRLPSFASLSLNPSFTLSPSFSVVSSTPVTSNAAVPSKSPVAESEVAMDASRVAERQCLLTGVLQESEWMRLGARWFYLLSMAIFFLTAQHLRSVVCYLVLCGWEWMRSADFLLEVDLPAALIFKVLLSLDLLHEMLLIISTPAIFVCQGLDS